MFNFCLANTLLILFNLYYVQGQSTKYFNTVLDKQNPSSVKPPKTDSGNLPSFKYPFTFAQRSVFNGGWRRQIGQDIFPIARSLSGSHELNYQGASRQMHWHTVNEMTYVLNGQCRLRAVTNGGHGFVGDLSQGDFFFAPSGFPHFIQGIGNNGCIVHIVFDQGNMNNDDDTFNLNDLMRHIPPEVLGKNFEVNPAIFNSIPSDLGLIFATKLPGSLKSEQSYVFNQTGPPKQSLIHYSSIQKPNISRAGGNVKIIDQRNFPITNMSAAIVTLKVDALRELHWHPNSDEWTYFVSGRARMGVFGGAGRARAMDFEESDVGYVEKSVPHYVENTGTTDLVFIEVFVNPLYEDISLAEWLAHTPSRLVNEHLRTGEEFLENINKLKAVITPV